jgi:transcriptional regulator GlxA family with amidase domain
MNPGNEQGTPPNAIAVAVLLDEGATIIDFAGPWDAFKAATDETLEFHIFSVAPKKGPLQTMGGLTLLPDYTFADAPQPQVIVIPAQGGGKDPAKLEWIRSVSRTADHVMSACTGSFVLARTGLLDGGIATTHPGAYDLFEQTFPKVKLRRDAPFVLSGKFSSASAGISGIDLALYIVSRYRDTGVAEEISLFMGHHSNMWRNQ